MILFGVENRVLLLNIGGLLHWRIASGNEDRRLNERGIHASVEMHCSMTLGQAGIDVGGSSRFSGRARIRSGQV